MSTSNPLELPEAEEILIVGAVGANGPGGSRSKGDELWRFGVELAAWRVLGQALNQTPLMVVKAVSEAELNRLQAEIQPETLFAGTVRLLPETPSGGLQAELKEVVPAPPDEELLQFLEAYAQPVHLHDAQFGGFILDKRVNWFEGKADWCGHSIGLSLCLDDDSNPRRALQVAHELWKTAGTWARALQTILVRDLLELKNESWLDDGEPEVSADNFWETMRLESVTVYPDGHLEFWYDDGDLFWGHSIMVSGSLESGPHQAGIHG